MRRKVSIFVLAVSFFFAAIGIIAVILENTGPNQPELPTSITPTPTSDIPQRESKVPYNPSSQQRLSNYLKSRNELSDADQQARRTVLESINSQTTVLSTSPNHKLTYLEAPDSFMVEIRTEEINLVKLQVATYFTERGISDEGLCRLPLVFYLNFNVRKQLEDRNITFDPLPLGC